jgi:malonyl-CoA/methylmalonyl-CoA synthetase
MLLARLHTIAAHLPADRVMLEHRGRTLTVAELETLVGRAVAGLAARGCRRGDRVALVLEKGLPFVALHLACLRAGLVSTPCNPAATADELAHIVRDAAPRLQLRDADAAELLADATPSGASPAVAPPPGDQRADELAMLLYTSGTTGRPKGVPLTHGSLAANVAALHALWEWSDRDVLVHALPLFHVHGLIVALHGALHAGATTLLLDGFDAPAVAATLAVRRATLFMGVPTMYHRLAQLPRGSETPSAPDRARADADRIPDALPGMRLFVCGSAPLRLDTMAAFRARWGHDILQRYGMTEALMITSQPLRGDRRPLSVGRALPGTELRVVDRITRAPLHAGEIGEVLVRGPSVFAGYWRGAADASRAATTAPPRGPAMANAAARDDATTPMPHAASPLDADGWLATGDLGSLDADGFLFLAGRARELIICGGFNIYPKEVERVLDGHPDVAESAVFGLPDDDLGEIVAAAVAPMPGRAPTVAALLEHCRAQLAPTKCPRVLALLDALPRNGMGKVQKQLLPARAEFARAGRPPREPRCG